MEVAMSAVPSEYHSVTPYPIVNDAAAAIEFHTKAFGAEEFHRLDGPGGVIVLAEVRIGDSPVMPSGEWPQ
jgi:PhnB protein